MTATTTPSDFLSPEAPEVPPADSPGASARARARIAATQSDSNSKTQTGPQKPWLSRQDFWTTPLPSLENAWRASRVTATRIPNDSAVLRRLWTALNGTERILLFALTMLAPAVLAGPLRILAQRPTRRIALYLTLAVLTAALLIF